MRSRDDRSDSILTMWDWLLLFPKWGRQLGEKDTIGAVMHCQAIVSWMICLFSTCLQSKAWNARDYRNGLSTTPRQIITGQAESQHMHATHPKKPNTVRDLCVRKHETARASLWMFDLQSGAQSLLPCTQAPCTENSSHWTVSLPPPSHQNPNKNTTGKSVCTLYFLSLRQHEENTKQKAHLYSYLSPQH